VNGKISSNNPLVSIKKRISSSPILMKDPQGKLRVFISVNSAADILEITATNRDVLSNTGGIYQIAL
jgi:hypothetical protein